MYISKLLKTKRFQKFLLLIALTLLQSNAASAGVFVIGRYAGEFLSLGASAKALAMGGAAVANPTATSSGYYNPSRLAGLTTGNVEFMHDSHFDNLYTYDVLSYAKPINNGYAGGLTVLYTRVGDIPLTKLADPNNDFGDDNRVLIDKNSSDNELAVMASVGKIAKHDWRIGATAKLLYKSLAEESAYGLGVDVGFGKSLSKHFDVGASVRDLTTSVLAWSTGRTEGILPSVLVGGEYRFELSSINAKVTLVGDLDGHFESRGDAEELAAGPLTISPRFGAEYLISNTVALRGGLNGDQISAGAGLQVSFLTVNAAFQDHKDLGFTHRISAGVSW